MKTEVQRTLILIKPDAVERGLIGEIIGRIERKRLKIVAMRLFRFDEELVNKHYGEHIGKPFFESLKQFVMRGPAVALAIEGNSAIEGMRKLMGATLFLKAEAGTIRGDFALSNTENLIHGSDSPESAAREIPLFFPDVDAHPAKK